MSNCGRCHTCGDTLDIVLDGEEWCEWCQTYRRYRTHGWPANHAPDTDPCSTFDTGGPPNLGDLVDMTRLNFPTARRALEHSIADVLDGYRDIDEALTEAANMVARGNIRFTAAGYTVTPHLICQAVREQRRLAHVGSR